MAITRRDLFVFGGGAAVSLPFTPLPYKLLDDVSIWTQNFPWIPTPRAGETTLRAAACTMCAAGCGVQVRCVDGRPIGIAPAPHHPVSRGALCAMAFGAHQLAWHPRRVRESAWDGKLAKPAEIAARIAEAAGTGRRLAILDERPGRAVSAIYRRAAKLAGGVYLTPEQPETAPLRAAQRLCGDAVEFGYDLDATKMLISFGAPVLDGWGVPGRMMALWKSRQTAFIHAGSRYSHTARLANEWLPLLPGTEAALALGLARVLADEGLAAQQEGMAGFRALLDEMPLNRAAGITGLKVETIQAVARRLREGSPALAVGGGDLGAALSEETETAIAALNALLGAVGKPGGLMARRPQAEDAQRLAAAQGVDEMEPQSIGLLLIEPSVAVATIPWKTLSAKLAPEAVVVVMSAYDTGYAAYAKGLVAVPAMFESIEETPSAPGAVRASYGLSPALIEAPKTAIAPVEFLAMLAERCGWTELAGVSTEQALQARVETIFAAKRGKVSAIGAEVETPVSGFESAGALYGKLAEGAIWMDDAAAAVPVKPRLPGETEEGRKRLLAGAVKPVRDAESGYPLVAVPAAWAGAAPAIRVPLAGKLDQESKLRQLPGEAAIHPATAKEFNVREGAQLRLESPHGECLAGVRVSDSVMRGVVEVTPGDSGGLGLFVSEHGETERAVRVRIGRA